MENFISTIGSLGRFWVAESFLSGSQLSAKEAVAPFTDRSSCLLKMFATEQGKKALDFR